MEWNNAIENINVIFFCLFEKKERQRGREKDSSRLFMRFLSCFKQELIVHAINLVGERIIRKNGIT